MEFRISVDIILDPRLSLSNICNKKRFSVNCDVYQPFDIYYKVALMLPGNQLRHYVDVRLLLVFSNIESSPALRQDKSYVLPPALKRITDNV